MRLQSILISLSAATLAMCRTIPDTTHQHERVNDWAAALERKLERLPSDTILPMRIALTQQNLDLGEQWLMEVSDPDSAKYGQHWAVDDVMSAFQPAQASIDAVMAWLTDGGIATDRITHSDNKQWLAFDVTTQEAEDLLQTEYFRYERANGEATAGCDDYRLPAHLRDHIDFVKPAVMRAKMTVSKRTGPRPQLSERSPGPIAGRQANSSDMSNCFNVMTPLCVRTLYNFTIQDSDAPVNAKNRFGIYETGQVYNQTDDDEFYKLYAPYIPQGTAPITDSIDGGAGPNNGTVGGEAELDFQVAYPIVWPQELVMYSVNDAYYSSGNSSDLGFGNTFLDAIDGSYCTYSAYGETGDSPIDPSYPDPQPGGYKGKLMCGVYKPTNVISVSYTESEIFLPVNYQKRQCNEYLKLGLQGVSMLFASGDTGVASEPYNADGVGLDGCLGPNETVYNPNFPNACPWVTAVGGTMLNITVFEPEVAVSSGAPTQFGINYFSGGGFSNVFPTPKYQRKAVRDFFRRADPGVPYYTNGIVGFDGNTTGDDGPGYNRTNGLYNRNGRAYPDVAANGAFLAQVEDGVPQTGTGTSASAPLFAGLIHRVNILREQAGKSPVGFINPVVYKHPEILHDITSGSNPGCGGPGFNATIGWDPVTGYGTPDFPSMVDFWLKLPGGCKN